MLYLQITKQAVAQMKNILYPLFMVLLVAVMQIVTNNFSKNEVAKMNIRGWYILKMMRTYAICVAVWYFMDLIF